jgi:rubrerythrin
MPKFRLSMFGQRQSGGEAARRVTPSGWDRALTPLHRWVWRDADRRARKLLRFAETEADGGRHLARAAERTRDPLLRRLFLRHALDEARHAELFRRRGRALRSGRTARNGLEANWLAPGERGLDELRVDALSEGALLAFLHFSERAAAGRFALYREMLSHDPGTREVFSEVLEDEEFHMTYTRTQLARLTPARGGGTLWRARARRLGRAYLRLAGAVAGVMGGLVLTVQYFLLLPWFAWAARRAARREPPGWRARPAAGGPSALESPY